MRHRVGLLLILGGIVLAAVTTLLVIRIANQATEATRAGIKQVSVVTATKDFPDQALITAEGLVVKPFPVDFAPPGALSTVDQVVGKFANGFISKNQVLVAGQLAPVRRSLNLSERVPPGKVAVWLPMPDLLSAASVLRPGDRVDILLSLPLGEGGGRGGALSTQTTLQNVEIFRLGQEEVIRNGPQDGSSDELPAQTSLRPAVSSNPSGQTTAGQGGQNASGQQTQAPTRIRAIGFLVDHQDAVTIKFIKDSGGTIDMVLRSTEEEQVVRTDAATMDSLVDRFRFRVPQPVTTANAAR